MGDDGRGREDGERAPAPPSPSESDPISPEADRPVLTDPGTYIWIDTPTPPEDEPNDPEGELDHLDDLPDEPDRPVLIDPGAYDYRDEPADPDGGDHGGQ